ncbi:MAG: hypothetical protein K8T20_16800 [Planctomycetes bacterium]|nr:hypothetical protein [Planctomycetota bacterium]
MGAIETRTGKHSVVAQRGGKGFHAAVEVEVRPCANFRLEIEADCWDWQAGVEFGVHYAWAALPNNLRRDWGHVRVVRFHGMIADTSHAIAALAAALAMFDAYGFHPVHPPRLDPDKGEIVFPKHPT